ncbi:sister chromatid cohesion protein Dcc1 [Parasitella parasitica]|nr:sister chromatid cohesion protein Dcc1 [Parasitella parasitica]
MTSSKLVYKDKYEKNSYSLIELGSSELVEAFESSNGIVIKGLADDEAVLCTESKTYIVRQVNTSNSLLLVTKESASDQYTVHDTISSTIELLPCVPRLDRIDKLLKDSSYSGCENERDVIMNKTLYSYHDLLSIIQASECELLDALAARAAFRLDGYFRLFDKTYLHHLFDLFVTNATVHSYDFEQMTLEQAKLCITEEMNAVDQEDNIPDQVVTACINAFVTDHVDINDNDKVLTFDHAKICRFLGEWLLSTPRNKHWELNDFLNMWRKLGYDIFMPKLEHIDGLYLMHETKRLKHTETHIQYFPITDLPTDPPQRFASLFTEREYWTSEEITPFLMDLAPQKKDREHLLLKFARTYKRDNTTYYASRIKQ